MYISSTPGLYHSFSLLTVMVMFANKWRTTVIGEGIFEQGLCKSKNCELDCDYVVYFILLAGQL